MVIISTVLIAFVALEHLGFLVLEMFLWDGPIGKRVFRLSSMAAAATKPLAANQGLYNGFLAAGLVWGLVAGRFDVKLFFLACAPVSYTHLTLPTNREV